MPSCRDPGGADADRLFGPDAALHGSPAEDVFAMALACWPAFCSNSQRGVSGRASFWPNELAYQPLLKLPILGLRLGLHPRDAGDLAEWLPPITTWSCDNEALNTAARCLEAASSLLRTQRPSAAACAEALLAAAHDHDLQQASIQLPGADFVCSRDNMRDLRRELTSDVERRSFAERVKDEDDQGKLVARAVAEAVKVCFAHFNFARVAKVAQKHVSFDEI